jgi:formiminotetrahydrofolate cyclodeaminase
MRNPESGTLWSATLAEFRDATASAEPTPGGGSVAGVTAALGLGLVIMALEVSINRKDAVQIDAAKALIGEARCLMAGLTNDADADVRAFGGYMAALKLPKVTDEEKQRRKQALQQATQAATETPLQAARHIVDALRIAQAAVPLSHQHVISDVGAGTALLDGALKAVLLNVDINLSGLADAELKTACARERSTLASDGAGLASTVLKLVSERLTH